MTHRALRATLTMVTLLTTLSGCGKFREISTCRAVVREVNPALAQIEALSKKPGPEAQTQMAKHYADLGKRLKPLGAGSDNLATAIRDYASILEATARALKSLAETSHTAGTTRVNEPRRELDRLVKRERAAVVRIDVECHS